MSTHNQINFAAEKVLAQRAQIEAIESRRLHDAIEAGKIAVKPENQTPEADSYTTEVE